MPQLSSSPFARSAAPIPPIVHYTPAENLEHVNVALLDTARQEIDLAAYVLTDWPIFKALTGRNAISHYDCLDFKALASLPVGELADDDCALFLWATDPLLPRAFELIQAWGFEYKTVGFYWVKLNTAAKHDADYFTGLGYWTRANPEQCILATRGKPQRQAKDVRRLVVDKRREHSRKPDAVRERIERLVRGPYLELFARETKPGWDCWGNQLALFDQGSVTTRRQPSRLVDAPQLLL